jgi:hypothetical protein
MVGTYQHPADWRGSELSKREDWIHRFTSSEVAEIIDALGHARAKGKTLPTLTQADFPLPNVSLRLEHARKVLEEDVGIFQFRGFDVSGLSKDDLRLIYWGLGKHMGTVVSQSSDGDLLGDVRNIGIDIMSPQGRGYKTNQKLSYHTDSCDVVGLFVMRAAKEGGLSLIASSVAIHNEIARRRPDLLAVLYQPFPWSWQTQEAKGAKPWYFQPIFSMCEDKISCRYIRGHIRNSQLYSDAPRLTEQQIEAMDYFDSLSASPEFHLSFMFEAGDIQFLNNHVCLHSRTSYTDWPEPDRYRHLLRMWLSVPNSRPLVESMGTIYQDQSPGAVRGGFPTRTGTYIYESKGSLTD